MGDTPEYVNKMQQEVFEVLAEARSLEDLRRIEPKARGIYRRYIDELDGADVKELAIHRRASRLNYSRRCAEASAVQAHMKQGLPLAPGMEIGYVVKDAQKKWDVGPERTASKFDGAYYRGLPEKTLGGGGVCVKVVCNWSIGEGSQATGAVYAWRVLASGSMYQYVCEIFL
jgi:DNA polymerase, archaea type